MLAALEKVTQFAVENIATVYMPIINCVLAGATWDKMEQIINKTVTAKNIGVTVFYFWLVQAWRTDCWFDIT